MRKIIQYYPETKYERPAALCDDGTLWGINSLDEWEQFSEIPQDSAVNKSRKDKICGNVVNASDSSFIIRFDGCNYRMCGMGVPEIGKLFIADSGKSICISDGSIFNARMILEEI
jgi:hypothetical protein